MLPAWTVRRDWTREELRALFALPFPELVFRAQTVHRRNFDPTRMQLSTLLSIKTGGCKRIVPIARRAPITRRASMPRS